MAPSVRRTGSPACARDEHRERSRHEQPQHDAARGAAQPAHGDVGTAIRRGIRQVGTAELQPRIVALLRPVGHLDHALLERVRGERRGIAVLARRAHPRQRHVEQRQDFHRVLHRRRGRCSLALQRGPEVTGVQHRDQQVGEQHDEGGHRRTIGEYRAPGAAQVLAAQRRRDARAAREQQQGEQRIRPQDHDLESVHCRRTLGSTRV